MKGTRSIVGCCLALALALVGLSTLALAEGTEKEEGPTREELVRIIRDLQTRVAALESLLRSLKESGVAGSEIEELQRQIDLLTRELEKRKLGEAAVSGPLESRYGLGPAASKVYGIAKGVSIGGYGEMILESFDSEGDDGQPSNKTDTFDFRRAVFYFGYKFNDRIVFNSEIEFEHASTEESGEVSVEFANLDFLLKDGLNIRAGMVLIPVGFINELHEPPVFLGANRPRVERIIIPATWRENGAGIFGNLGPFSYRTYLVSSLRAIDFSGSSGIRGGRQQGSKSKAEDFALTGRLDWSPGGGLLLGGSFFTGDTGQGEIMADARTTVWDLHGKWKWKGWQFRGLYSRVDIDDTDVINAANGQVVGEEMFGWYAEAGYDLLSHRRNDQSLIAFLRVSEYNTQDEVAAGFMADPANDVDLLTVGLGYRPIPQIMIKADFQNFDNEAGTGVDQFNFGVTYLF